METIRTTDDLMKAFDAAGSLFFTRKTARFFGSRTHRPVYPGKPGAYYFVTSEWVRGRRRYTVRLADLSTLCVWTCNVFGQYAHRSTAHRAAQRLANRDVGNPPQKLSNLWG